MVDKEWFDLYIEKVVSRGLGLGFHEGVAVFVPFTAPGDTIRARWTKQRRTHRFAHCLEVLVCGSERKDPVCALFTQCGGCQLRHLSGCFQRKVKEASLLETLGRFPNLRDLGVVQPVLATGCDDGYRRRVGFKVRWLGARLLLGFFQPSSQRIADLPAFCPVLVSGLSRLIEPLRSVIVSLSIRDALPQVDAVVGTQGIGLIFHLLSDLSERDSERLRQFAKEQGIVQLWLQRGRKSSMEPLVVEEVLSYTVAGHTLNFHPGDFIQAHGAGNAILLQEAITQAGKGQVAWDLFCGIGNFTVPLAQNFSSVLGVESNASTLKRARNNAKQCSSAIHFKCLDLFKRRDIEHLKTEKPADLVLLDPPREGALDLVKWLVTTSLQRLVYVSCNPATFARDAAILVHGGLQMERVQPIDLFPHTFHVELVALFVRRSSVFV